MKRKSEFARVDYEFTFEDGSKAFQRTYIKLDKSLSKEALSSMVKESKDKIRKAMAYAMMEERIPQPRNDGTSIQTIGCLVIDMRSVRSVEVR